MARFTSLMYHNLSASPSSPYDVSPEVFESQLDWLLGEGFVVEDFAGLADRLAIDGKIHGMVDGKSVAAQPIPDRYVVLGFDDGHRSNLEASEILEARGLKATFFCSRDVSRRDEFLDESGIRELASSMTVGSHGATHRALTKMPFEEARRELEENREWLQDVLGSPVPFFSAPFGELDRRLLAACIDEGHELIGDSMEWRNDPVTVVETRLVHRIMISGAGSRADQRRRFRLAASVSSPYFLKRRARYEIARLTRRMLSEKQILRLARLKRRVLS